MGNREVNRIDPGKIGRVHRMLPAGASVGMLAERAFQRVNRAVEHRHDRQAKHTASLFQPDPDFGIGEREKDQAGIVGNFAHDPVQVLERADHRPEVTANFRPFKLGQRSLGDHFQRFAGGIGQQMEVQARHEALGLTPVDSLPHKPRDKAADKFGEQFAAHYPHPTRLVVDRWIRLSTGPAQWGQPLLDAAIPGFATAFRPVQPGTIRAGTTTPAFHWTNYLQPPYPNLSRF